MEFEDELGVRRKLTKEELLMYINVLAVAGNETTGRLISFTGELLADHPDQRRDVADDVSLIPNVIEEVMRYEPPALQTCRYVARDAEHYGQTVPEGSAMLLLLASANRDERRYDDPDASTSAARPTTTPSGSAPTSASAPTWPGSKPVSCSRRPSGGGPNGRSTPTTPNSRSRPHCAAGRRSPSGRHEHDHSGFRRQGRGHHGRRPRYRSCVVRIRRGRRRGGHRRYPRR